MKSMQQGARILCLVGVTAVMAGCSGLSKPTVANESNVSYGDAKAVETTSIEFGSTDLQMIAEKMTQSMLESPALTGRPTMVFGGVKNRTSEYIDTKNITSSIMTALQKSNKVKIVGGQDSMEEGINEIQKQNQSGLYKKSTTAKVGNFVGAKFRVQGEFTSIVKQNKSLKDVYYKFTMTMYNVEENSVEWMEEKEIRKTAQK
jgi:uncharacterized protein (TIGR02722 family)